MSPHAHRFVITLERLLEQRRERADAFCPGVCTCAFHGGARFGDPTWKWISSFAQPGDDARELGGLFDLRADPFEVTDVRAGNAATASRLEGRLEQVDPVPGTAAATPPHAEMPAEVRNALEALGYLEPAEEAQ